MPTRVMAERGPLLRRALESVLTQHAVRVVPIIVVNGPDAHPALCRELRGDRRIRVTTLEQPDLPAAIRAGRALVDTPFFAELDDDDILLPGALSVRVHAIEEAPRCHAVVTNGLRRDSTGDTLHIRDMSILSRDPLRALLQDNWLLPGSWLCRTDSVGSSLFEGMPRYLECTYLAARLASSVEIRFLSQPTVVWHADTPLSVSKSREYVLGQVAALNRILELDLPRDVRAIIRARVTEACHAIADLHVEEGNFSEAWVWHRRSLREPGGWRHLLFTRRLVYGAWGA